MGDPVESAAKYAGSLATKQRLDYIIRNGGPMPEGTRVVGAMIIEVNGYSGPVEWRAISGSETDFLGDGAIIPHAPTPDVRTLSAARGIGGAALRKEFPFYHINDAEVKLLEAAIARLPKDATGRISLMTMRSKNYGAILEPIAACSGCTHVMFQVKGDFRGIDIGSYAPTPPTVSIDLESTEPPVSAPGGRLSGIVSTAATVASLISLIGGFIPDPSEPKLILDHLDEALKAEAWQQRVADLAPAASQLRGNAYYNITYKVKYQGHQSAAVRHFGPQYYVRDIEVLAIDVSGTDVRKAGDLTPKDRPPDARPMFGGGWEWDAERTIVTSVPVTPKQ